MLVKVRGAHVVLVGQLVGVAGLEIARAQLGVIRAADVEHRLAFAHELAGGGKDAHNGPAELRDDRGCLKAVVCDRARHP